MFDAQGRQMSGGEAGLFEELDDGFGTRNGLCIVIS